MRAPDRLAVGRSGWPPPLMHPPGQVITSMKCRSLAAGADLVQQFAGVAQAAGHGHAQFDAVDLNLGLLDALHAADGLHFSSSISLPVTR